MIRQRCCERRTATGGPPARTLTQRCREIVEFAAPGATLLLLPKCPACVAAYFAIGTGIGLSISAATYVRTGLVTVCVISLLWLTARRYRIFRGPEIYRSVSPSTKSMLPRPAMVSAMRQPSTMMGSAWRLPKLGVRMWTR